jgi:hypothetical protein
MRIMTDWAAWGSNPGRGKRFFSIPKSPYRRRGPSTFIFNDYRGLFLRELSGRIPMLTTDFHIAPRLGICGATDLLYLHAFMALTGTTLVSKLLK